jgi:hypothetical protein
MSLLRNREMTEKKLAAIRRNQTLSHGPVTDEGRVRTHPNARLLRRMQDSNVREVQRLTNLLLKLERYA